MTRDELILTALAARLASTADLARMTGLTERTCRNGLHHLIAEGYAWSPERGRWRLTEAGQAIASALPAPRERASGLPASLGWALAGVVAVVALAVARRLSAPLPEPPISPPSAWPYDGWQG